MSSQPQTKRIRQPINGVLLLDKPVTWSSNDALIKTKNLLNAQKAGHTGTLDPFATGLLPLCFGEATKFSHDLLHADKTYETTIHLGMTTNTGDTEGEIIASNNVEVTLEEIKTVLAQFVGDILQIPPMHSALKRDGKPLYEYARQGIELEREARPVTIHHIRFIAYDAPFLHIEVKCSKGTYIRVLGEDIGKALGCGAHLKTLRRTQVAHLNVANAISLAQFEQQDVLMRIQKLAPVDALLSSFPYVIVDEVLTKRFMQGQRLSLKDNHFGLSDYVGRVRVYSLNYQSENLLGSALWNEESILSPERLVSNQMADKF